MNRSRPLKVFARCLTSARARHCFRALPLRLEHQKAPLTVGGERTLVSLFLYGNLPTDFGIASVSLAEEAYPWPIKPVPKILLTIS